MGNTLVERWRILRQSPTGLVGACIIVLYIVMATLGPLLVHQTVAQNLAAAYQPPSWQHWLGTDYAGRGILTQIIYGSRPVLIVAVVAAAIGVFLGTVIGLVAGFSSGIVDSVLMRVGDFFLTIPGLPFIIVMTSLIHSTDPLVMAGIISITSWAGLARAIRSQTMSMAKRDFIEVAKVQGLSLGRVVRKELLPNLGSYVAMNFLLAVIGAIYAEVGLFLLGVAPFSGSNWGIMLNIAMNQAGALYTTQSLWYLMSPMAAIVILQLGLVMFSQGLDVLINPRLRKA